MFKENSGRNQKDPIYFYLLLVLIPILFFVLLEIGLRLFAYGTNNRQWVEVTEGKLMLNPDIARRYFFTTHNIPISIQDVFDKTKKPNAFRVFILGESSVAGYPYLPIGSFSRLLQRRLELLYPNSKIEVVNIGMTAVNSYALRDMFVGVLEQKPDLILIYSGHNEYYGALGIGSMESLGTNRAIVNLTLYLNKFKTVELLRNVIKAASKLFSGKEDGKHDGTLMSRIAKDQFINYDSEKFYKGLSQYENNMRDILEMAKDNKVPVILGTLTNNLKDQPPFISIGSSKYPFADKVYESAKIELKFKHLHSADSLFRLAKDLDVLRFRASEKMNQLINRLGKKFNCSVVQIDSAFNAASPDGIVGNNLMTDHLHPTLEGYKLMSKLYFGRMKEMNYLPSSEVLKLTEHEQDSLTAENFKFSKLDSVVAEYRLIVLKNDWPFVNKLEAKSLSDLIKPNDFIEKTAYRLSDDRVTWELAQREVAGWYLLEGDYAAFQNQMEVLISQYPVVVEYYDFAANELLKVEKYDDAYKFLCKRYRIIPNAYSTKWLGIINLSKNKTDDAIKYLEESLMFGSNDPQVLYNIAGAYSYKKEYQKALDAINKCLRIDPQFPKAVELKNQLQSVANKKAG